MLLLFYPVLLLIHFSPPFAALPTFTSFLSSSFSPASFSVLRRPACFAGDSTHLRLICSIFRRQHPSPATQSDLLADLQPKKKQLKMAAVSASSKVSLKLLIDKKAQKVLFAEGNKEFVDFLFHILSLPVGTVIKLLTKDSMLGSLGNLYNSVENLNDTYYIEPNQSKESILNPKIANDGAHVPLLLPHNGHVPMAKKFYTCSCGYHAGTAAFGHSMMVVPDILYVADDPSAVCLRCNVCMSKEMTYVAGSGAAKVTTNGGGFVKGVVTYMIMDDLEVKPMSTISSITMLNKFNVKEIDCLEEKVVSFDMKEGLMLLKASFECKNVLTTVFLSE